MEEEELGLAQMVGNRSTGQYGLKEIVAMLMQGVDAEDLIEMGIPKELVIQAIQELTSQMQAQQPANQEGGLASMSVQPQNV